MSYLAMLRIPVAVLLLVAAVGKAGALGQILRPRSARRWDIAAGAVAAETMCGVSLLAPHIERLGSAAAAGLGLAFLGYRGKRRLQTASVARSTEDCGCLGDRLRPRPAAELALPWIVLLGGIAGAVSAEPDYARPLIAWTGAGLALALVAGLAAASRTRAVPLDREIFRSVFRSQELASLDDHVRRSLEFRPAGPGTWVSTDFTAGNRIMNVTVHVRTRVLGAPVIAITSQELMLLS
jgi:hypothetical protein